MTALRSLLLLVLLAPQASSSDDVPQPRIFAEVLKAPNQPQVLQYRSKIYGDLQRFGFCATAFDDQPKPLIVELIPGTYDSVRRAARDCAKICRIAEEAGLACVAVRPCGLGNGSVFQGFGEVDVYDVIETVAQVVAIDRDRITVTGASMGGAATWYHASHYPDVWAAAAPFCGYCDYQLWKKPGGTTFHRSPWEEYSWRSRGASYRVENLRRVPVRMIHGEWDRSVGGGVDVEHSRSMDRKLTKLEFTHQYHEIPETGHGCRTNQTLPPTIRWLLQQRKARDTDKVSLVVHGLRHNTTEWVAVQQQIKSGRRTHVEAVRPAAGKRVDVRTDNVSRLQLGPIPNEGHFDLRIDDTSFDNLNFSKASQFTRAEDGGWNVATAGIPPKQKRSGLSGPLGDMFFEPVVIIYGTSGSAEAAHHNATMAYELARFFSRWNGGLHRGGINGDIDVRIPVLSDIQMHDVERGDLASTEGENADSIRVDKNLLKRANLLVIGDVMSNAVTKKLADHLPLAIDADAITLGGKRFPGSGQACLALFPHPDNARYVAVLAGQTPDAICGASHLGLQLLPDFLVFQQESMIDWGFWDNHWKRGP